MYRRFIYSIVIGMLISSLAIGAEVRKLGVNDLQYGPDVTSPAGKAVKGIQPVDVRAYGAVTGVTSDSSAAITAALAAASTVVIDNLYRVDSMISLDANQTLILLGGAELRRTTDTANTDPVVWIKSSYATLAGQGKNSIISTQNRSPRGVVRLGHKDMTESHGNVLYCSLRNLRITGQTQYGQTSGDPDVGVYMANPQFSGLASYFHSVSGLHINQVNYGMELVGWANANFIYDIQLYQVGNSSGGRAGIYIRGTIENYIGQVFHHYSSDSYSLVVENYNNTGLGGDNHIVYYNVIGPIICEQGGSLAKCLVVNSIGSANQFTTQANVTLGNDVPAAFYDNNFIINTEYASFPAIKSKSGTTSCLDNTATTLFSVSKVGTYIISYYLPASGATIQSTATIVSDGLEASKLTGGDAAAAFLTLSGTNVQGRQSTGSTQTMSWNYLRIN